MKQLLTALAVLFGASAYSMVIQFQVYAESCTGGDGVILATVTGGVPPYSYAWSNGPTVPQNYALTAGIYSLTVTDNLGAQATAACEVLAGQIAPLNGFTGVGGLEACAGIPDGGFRLHLLRISGMYSISTSPNLSYIELPEDEGGTIDSYITYEFLGAWGGTNVQLSVTNNCGTSNTTVLVEQLSFPQLSNYTTTGSCTSGDDGSLFGQVLLAPMSQGWNLWTMVAVDAPVGGNYVWPTPTLFNAGTTAFQLFGLHPAVWNLLFTTIEGPGSAQLPCEFVIPVPIPDLGPDCATVSGTMHFETDADCVQDGVEMGVPYQVLRVSPGPLYGITDQAGQYDIAVPYGSYDLEQLNPDAVQLCPPAAPIAFAVSLGNNATIDIADSLLTPFNMGLSLWNHTSRVGMPFVYYMDLINSNGYTGENVVVTLDYDPIFSFVSSSPGLSSNTAGQVQWSFPALAPFENRHLYVVVQVPPDPLLLGTSHTATATATSATSEPNTADNTQSRTHIVVASYDPNDKQVFTSSGQNEAVYLLDVDTHIDYLIRFQNTGSDTAFNITVTDTIGFLLDMASLQILGASHAFTPHIATGNVLEFHFENILLPDSNVNELASHGYIAFRMKPITGITIGATIDNAADIFFDFNDPVRTNTASLEVGVSTGLTSVAATGLHLSPVPVADRLSIRADEAVITSVLIHAMDGRLVAQQSGRAVVDVSALAAGTYVLLARTQQGNMLRARFIKE